MDLIPHHEEILQSLEVVDQGRVSQVQDVQEVGTYLYYNFSSGFPQELMLVESSRKTLVPANENKIQIFSDYETIYGISYELL